MLATAFDPAVFLGKRFRITEEDERSLALIGVDIARVRLISCLQAKEIYISGEENLRRLKATDYIRLDARFFLTLWQNQDLMLAEWQEPVQGQRRSIFFDGSVIMNPGKCAGVLCLYWLKGRWRYRGCWLGSVRYSCDLSAVMQPPA